MAGCRPGVSKHRSRSAGRLQGSSSRQPRSHSSHRQCSPLHRRPLRSPVRPPKEEKGKQAAEHMAQGKAHEEEGGKDPAEAREPSPLTRYMRRKSKEMDELHFPGLGKRIPWPPRPAAKKRPKRPRLAIGERDPRTTSMKTTTKSPDKEKTTSLHPLIQEQIAQVARLFVEEAGKSADTAKAAATSESSEMQQPAQSNSTSEMRAPKIPLPMPLTP